MTLSQVSLWRRSYSAIALSGCMGLVLAGCASGHCYKSDNRGVRMEESQFVQSLDLVEKTVMVKKADGSLQCGEEGIARNGQSEEEMRKELDAIPVFNQRKDHDGVIRITQCGLPTGRINIYEIPEKYLGEALRRGFTQWQVRKEAK